MIILDGGFMSDNMTREERSKQMALVKNWSKLPGKPDLVFVKRKKVVFLHGCFWHRHPGCSNTRLPKSNVEFWEKKLSQNVFHDREVYKQLTQLGWEYLIIWECEMKKSNRTSLEKRIHLFMDGDKYDH